MKDDTVLSFDQLNSYINTHVKDDNLIDDWVYGWFVPTMKDIMLTTFKAVKHKLAHKVRSPLDGCLRLSEIFCFRKFLAVLLTLFQAGVGKFAHPPRYIQKTRK